MNRFTRIVFVGITLAACLTASGCVTTFGYVPENLKVRQMQDGTTVTPSYGEVKRWAYDVADGYDSRSTMNRRAIYFGALFGAAAIGALAGLAVFDAGSPAITGIPIGTAFLSGVAAIYNSEEKAVIYDLASKYVKDLVLLSDERIGTAKARPDAAEAICLRRDVNGVMRKVAEHLALLDPKNIVQRLKAVGSASTGPEAQAAALKVARDVAGDLSDLKPPVKSVCGGSVGDGSGP